MAINMKEAGKMIRKMVKVKVRVKGIGAEEYAKGGKYNGDWVSDRKNGFGKNKKQV